MTAINNIKSIASNIKNWDRADANHLAALVRELRAACDALGLDAEAFVDFTSLPTCEIAEDIDTSYPVWAVDFAGRALVGDSADQVEALADIQ